MSLKPRIAINCDLQPATGTAPARAFLYLPYLEWVARAGGLPVVVPPVPGAEELLDDCHGVLFTGGDDYLCSVDSARLPSRFVAVLEERENSDLALARAALDQDLPVFGICLGFQLLVLAAGGTVYGDLEDELGPSEVQHRRSDPEQPLPTHAIQWLEDTAELQVSCGRYRTNSHHHQAVRRLPSGWRSLATSEDGLVEAAAGPGSYQVGVQWHAEREHDTPLSRSLAASLVAAARRRALEPGR